VVKVIKEFKRGTQITKNFKADEFICKCAKCQTAGIAYLDDKFIAKLQAFRDKLGKPIIIRSGNRCEAYNKAVSGAASSRHLSLVKNILGKLVPKYCDGSDIHVDGISADDLAVRAEAFGFTGVGVYRPSTDYIHADTRPGKLTCWWEKTSGSNTPGFGGKPVVFKSGHRSPAISKIQAALGLKPDGKGTMDAKTVAALKACQKANGIKVDGAFGPESNAKLKVFAW